MKGKRHSGITIIFLVEIICNAWLSRVRVQCLMSFFLLSNGCRSSRIFGEFKDTSNYLITTLNFVDHGVGSVPMISVDKMITRTAFYGKFQTYYAI
jgi:hypothetical protein